MTEHTDREALTEVIASTYTVFSDDHGELADAILAKFLPAHDERVREQTLRDFLSYRMLPSDVREYVSEYLKAGREASGD